MSGLGRPRLHLRRTGSTNDLARALAVAGAPHGTAVTTFAQTAGRGRQGRRWVTPAGQALAVSVVVRELDPLLPLRAGLAVADLAGDAAGVKWPNDVLLAGRKVSGVLVEARPREGWAVIGMGVNVAVVLADLPPEVREIAGTLGRSPTDLEPALAELLAALGRRLGQDPTAALDDLRVRDVLLGERVRWPGGEGTGAGIDDTGSLVVRTPNGTIVGLDAGEVHLHH